MTSVSAATGHDFHKRPCPCIRLIAGIGVDGDAHAGVTVRHRSRVAQDPSQPNLRQIHLLSAELIAEMAAQGFTVAPGDLGENLVTEGIDLHALPRGTRLTLGPVAAIEVTGLRNPCAQIDAWQPGLLASVLRRENGRLIRRAGIMGIVQASGTVTPGDAIAVTLPPKPHAALERV